MMSKEPGKAIPGTNDAGDVISVCGIVMPISAIDSYDTGHWSDVEVILERGIKQGGFKAQPVWESIDTDIIQSRIIRNIYQNPMLICDISGLNPNVMFELGMRLIFRKPVIIVADDRTKLPFDTNVIEHLIYPSDLHFRKIEKFIDEISNKLSSLEKSCRENKYKPYLDSFGAFTVVEPEQNNIKFDDFVVTRLEQISSSVQNLERGMRSKLTLEDLYLRPEETSMWTDDRVKLLTNMWQAGMSASQIAEKLNMNRNAVIGKAHRLGLKSRLATISSQGREE